MPQQGGVLEIALAAWTFLSASSAFLLVSHAGSANWDLPPSRLRHLRAKPNAWSGI